MGKLVYGVGVNDAGYVVQKYETTGQTLTGKRVRKLIWSCPFYVKWKGMLERCYSEKYLLLNPSYLGCSVIQDWHIFSNFKVWMETQDWEGKQLDKDILLPKNKIYSPNTCVFVHPRVNTFVSEKKLCDGRLPTGVSFNKSKNKYQASCWDVQTGKLKYLGLFHEAEDAHKVWLAFKLEQAKVLAAEQSDERVANALIERYTNYK